MAELWLHPDRLLPVRPGVRDIARRPDGDEAAETPATPAGDQPRRVFKR